jgi:hypothetical protein
VTHLVAYRLRDPNDRAKVFGDDIEDEEAAFARAQQLADFYRLPIEVCQVALSGRVSRVLGAAQPGPTAPGHPLTRGRHE